MCTLIKINQSITLMRRRTRRHGYGLLALSEHVSYDTNQSDTIPVN